MILSMSRNIFDNFFPEKIKNYFDTYIILKNDFASLDLPDWAITILSNYSLEKSFLYN